MIMAVLISLSFAIILVYMAIYVSYRGLPNSISDTHYSTEKKWLFPVTIGLAVMLAVVPLFELTREPYKFLAFFIIAGILFVTAAPAFKEQFEGKIHCISAIIAGISAVIWLLLMNGIPYITLVCALIGIVDIKRIVFWIEVGLSINLYVVLLYLTI